MSKKCRAYSESKLGLGPPDNRKSFYAGWDAALEATLAQQAEPVQEPAGWFEGPFGAFRANQLYKIAWPASTVAWSIPLYAAPPQRKPLTDEEKE